MSIACSEDRALIYRSQLLSYANTDHWNLKPKENKAVYIRIRKEKM